MPRTLPIAARLRELEDFARLGGAPDAFLREVMLELVELVVDDVGARRLQALQRVRALRELVDELKGAHYTGAVDIAARRLRIHRSTAYRQLSRADATAPAVPSRHR